MGYPAVALKRTASMSKVVADTTDFARIVRTTTIPAPCDGCVRYVPPSCDASHTTAPHSSPSPAGASSLPYTASPSVLLLSDIVLFCGNAIHLPNILLPVRSTTPKKPSRYAHDTDELTLTFPNMFSFLAHVVLFIVQFVFILTLPYLFLLPLWLGASYVAVFVFLNFIASTLFLNGTKALRNQIFLSDNGDDVAGEKWVFINGVACGAHWMQMNLERIALCFGRRVYGVHNPTFGIIFDVVECLLQRCFHYETQDVRTAFSYVKRSLQDKKCKKLVLLCHSQGGLEASLVVDMLLAECSKEILTKLEIYTFGCAANHFNSPGVEDGDDEDTSTCPTASSTTTASDVRRQNTPTRRDEGVHFDSDSETAQQVPPPECDHSYAIKHIEHYANSEEFVARWGILSFAGVVANKYAGAMFERRASGHLMNQHYLANMFALEEVGGTYRVIDKNDFMDAKLVGDDRGRRRNGLIKGRSVVGKGAIGGKSAGADGSVPSWEGKKVKEYSRLWLYRNGMSPQE